MTEPLDQLVHDVITATGAAPPDLLAGDSPALASDTDAQIYFVSLIGGKDVGKSSLVNALVGLPITAVTSSGPGTEMVIAYAHQSAVAGVQDVLEKQVPGNFRIVGHDNAALARQVLLDLPDIDSIHADHIETTRRMLRQTLYPIWLQSVEKYADDRPRKLLARVAEGNDADNFLFALNKVDLVAQREGREAIAQIVEDYAARIGKTLRLSRPPRVYAISASRPALFDLPALRERLSQQKTLDEVSRSQDLAIRQRSRTLLAWLERQDLPAQAQRADRLAREATEVAYERLAAPLLDSISTRLADDPVYRARLIEPAVSTRLARWPIVGAINAMLSPLLQIVHKSTAASVQSAPDVVLNSPDSAPLSQRIAATFAHIARLNPAVMPMYQHRKLWEEPAAIAAGGELRTRLTAAAQRQQQAVIDRAGGRSGWLAPMFRLLLTVGAALWFPILQPIAEVLVARGWTQMLGEMARLLVGIFSSAHLLQSLGFLLLWYLLLWMLLRWHTQQRAARLIRRWQTDESTDPQLSFAAQTLQWLEDLLAPLRLRQQAMMDLARREGEIRSREDRAARRAA